MKRSRDGTQVQRDTISEGKDVEMRLILLMKSWHVAWTRKEDLS